jgi:preprotein translocase subunit SecA
MASRVKATVVERLFKVQIVRDSPVELPTMTAWADVQESRGALPDEMSRKAAPTAPRSAPRTASGEKVGRNDPCPCGSGKKYKKCCYLKQST